MTDETLIALLVDADNVSAENIAFALAEARKSGIVTIRRAFGRLTSIKGREKALMEMGFAAEVALPGAKSKDTADLLLAQYAVRLAERGVVDLIALVSSDSDFAAIAQGDGTGAGIDRHRPGSSCLVQCGDKVIYNIVRVYYTAMNVYRNTARLSCLVYCPRRL